MGYNGDKAGISWGSISPTIYIYYIIWLYMWFCPKSGHLSFKYCIFLLGKMMINHGIFMGRMFVFQTNPFIWAGTCRFNMQIANIEELHQRNWNVTQPAWNHSTSQIFDWSSEDCDVTSHRTSRFYCLGGHVFLDKKKYRSFVCKLTKVNTFWICRNKSIPTALW